MLIYLLVLFRVKADSAYYRGGPIFDGFSFEFIPIPEREATESNRKSSYGKLTYSNTVNRKRAHPFARATIEKNQYAKSFKLIEILRRLKTGRK